MNAEAILYGIVNGVSRDPASAILLILVVCALLQNFFLMRRLARFMKGGNGASLESAIRSMQGRIEKLEANAAEVREALKNHEGRITRAVQAVSVMRFDPFGGASGQQSFSAALLNEKGDGAVISGIHARDGVRVYAKEVNRFGSERELSEDEESAITNAQKKLS